MRIVYLTHQYLPHQTGGTEVYTYGLAKRARRAGHFVQVITCVESPSLNAAQYGVLHTEHDGIPVSEIHFNLSVGPNPALAEYNNPFTGTLVEQELENIRPDLLHAMHLMKVSGSALEVCYTLNIPVVITLADYWFVCPRHTLLRWNHQLCNGPAHDLDCMQCLHQTHGFAAGRMQSLPAPLLRFGSNLGCNTLGNRLPRFWRDIDAIRKREAYLRRMVERADRVIALSDFQKEMFVRNGYAADKIQVLHHGLETEGLERRASSPKAELEVVFIGSLVYHKGPHILLKALAMRPELRLRILLYGDASGSNSYLDSLKAMVAADDRVSLMGTFALDDMGRVLQTADVLAMPALWYENEPLVVKAAKYVGIPVMASNLGTLATSIRQGQDGWLVPDSDVEAWASALARLPLEIRPPRIPDRSIKSMNENARELFAIYREILSNR